MAKTSTEYMREWRARHPEYADYMRKWRAAHKEALQAYRQARYQANRDDELADSVRWAEQHPFETLIASKVTAANRRYKGRITSRDVRAILERDGLVCHWCKVELTWENFTLEHLRRVNDPSQITIACRPCNAARLPRFGLSERLTKAEYLARRKSKKLLYDNRWRREHIDQVRVNQRARYWANIEERRAYFREWQRKKRERDRAKQRG